MALDIELSVTLCQILKQLPLAASQQCAHTAGGTLDAASSRIDPIRHSFCAAGCRTDSGSGSTKRSVQRAKQLHYEYSNSNEYIDKINSRLNV